MFTVKATYRNETRKLSFPASVLFPSYKELYDQLARVFPISRSSYLSRLIFSPDASKPGRILVGKEVHSALDYDSYVAPLRRVWPNPLLRFIIFDAAPHDAPAAVSDISSLCSAPTVPFADSPPKAPSPAMCAGPLTPPLLIPPAPGPSPFCILPTPSPPSPSFKISPPPPPPIIFSSPPPAPLGIAATTPCCAIAKGKADVEFLLSSFKVDLDNILRRTFGSTFAAEQCATAVASACDAPPSAETPVSLAANTSRWCFVCKTSFTGVWYGCVKCPWHAVCPGCFSKSHGAHTLSFGPSHVVQQRSSAHTRTTPPTIMEDRPRSSENDIPSSDPAPVVHRGIICDSCNKTVLGVRHRCLDCPDYDLCTACMQSDATERHNPFHEFLEIATPGRIYVHTVYDRDTRERLTGNRPQGHHSSFDNSLATAQETAAVPANGSVRHPATCNLCDSAIIGERYKCVVCPDFDTCSSCFRITAEQHPAHGFVRVVKPEDLVLRDSLPRRVTHHAVCDSCRKMIYGVRFKCLHPSCPDFDLCGNCEALPIAVHPPNHPMLKMKSPGTIIPTVYRVGHTQMINESTSGKSTPAGDESHCAPLIPRSPVANPVKTPELTPVVISDQAVGVPAEDQIPPVEEFLSPLGSPDSNILGPALTPSVVVPSHLLVDVADSTGSPRSVHPRSDAFVQLWPGTTQEMAYLKSQPTVNSVEEALTEPVVRQSFFVAEGRLPEILTALPVDQESERHATCPVSPASGTESVDYGYRTPSPVPSNASEPHPIPAQLFDDRQQDGGPASLSSEFLGDTNVPDGQIFPPGAEFVKGWHVMNNGKMAWPVSTEVQFVAGEIFAREAGAALKAKVGAVYPGQELDIWTGDLKAPDVPGRYVSYWRLNDGQGNFFGSNVWIDLTVIDHQSEEGSEHSLAASSMVMPSTHSNDPDSAPAELRAPQPSLPSSKTVTDELEDPESDASSVSLVSVPTSDEEDAEWQDTRTHSEPLEYVVLYGERSEE